MNSNTVKNQPEADGQAIEVATLDDEIPTHASKNGMNPTTAEVISGQNRPERKSISLVPSGRFIIDQDHRKIAEMYQPGDSPAEMEAIKSRVVRSFNALPDLIGVLMRADKEGALWQALFNEGITDSYDVALAGAVSALGEDGIADIALRYELDPDSIRAKLVE